MSRILITKKKLFERALKVLHHMNVSKYGFILKHKLSTDAIVAYFSTRNFLENETQPNIWIQCLYCTDIYYNKETVKSLNVHYTKK